MPEFQLSKDFVRRVTSKAQNEPHMAGGAPAPLPVQELAWLRTFLNRLAELGLSPPDTVEFMLELNESSLDFSRDPREAAENALKRWDAE